MTTPKKPAGKRKAAKRPARVKRKAPARSGPIRTGSHLPKEEEPASAQPAASMSPQAHVDADLDEGMINQAVADAVRNANKVLTDTVAQGRVAAEQFRHGDYNVRDVPVDVQIMGMRMIKLARELSETTLNIIEQILRQTTRIPPAPQSGQPGKVPPFPTGKPANGAPPGSSGAPPSSHPAPPAAPDNTLKLTVKFEGKAKAKALPSPLWKPSKPTLPSQLSITPMLHLLEEDEPITEVSFEADLSGQLIATVTIPKNQSSGIYAGMVVPVNTDVPLGVLSIKIME